MTANMEKALFSHIWNFARSKGLTKLTNPCAGIKRIKEDGRKIYIDDKIYSVVWDAAEQGMRTTCGRRGKLVTPTK